MNFASIFTEITHQRTTVRPPFIYKARIIAAAPIYGSNNITFYRAVSAHRFLFEALSLFKFMRGVSSSKRTHSRQVVSKADDCDDSTSKFKVKKNDYSIVRAKRDRETHHLLLIIVTVCAKWVGCSTSEVRVELQIFHRRHMKCCCINTAGLLLDDYYPLLKPQQIHKTKKIAHTQSKEECNHH